MFAKIFRVIHRLSTVFFLAFKKWLNTIRGASERATSEESERRVFRVIRKKNSPKMEEDEEIENCEDDEDEDEEWWDRAEEEEWWGEPEEEPVLSKLAPKKGSRKTVEDLPVEEVPDTGGGSLSDFARAIQAHEGWFPPRGGSPRGSTSFRNNNPGNLKFIGQSEATGKDERGFAIFPNYSAGFRALQFDINAKIRRNPGWNFEDFFKVYAPSSDNNRPLEYAAAVAKRLGVSPKTKLNVLFP